MYILIDKCGICGQISLSETVFFISYFLSFLYPSNYFHMWTSSCFSILCFLSFVYLQNIFKKWTGGQPLKIFIKKNNFNLMYFIIIKCGLVDKKLFFYFTCSFFCVPFEIFSKCVDTRTNSENYYQKEKFKPNVFQHYKVWTCGQEAVFLFHVFFLSCTFQNIFKKCGQVDMLRKV